MWIPQRGPQLAAIEADWCDELFFGGSRGGGKSDFQLGYQQDGAIRYEAGWRGIMFRKTYPELEELQARALEVFPLTGATFKTQPSSEYPFSNCWYWPNGATVKMRYIEREQDYGRYHGHQYCVGVGTPVLMADGSWCPIEAVGPGEEVMTLEGPKRVLATVVPYVAPCVRIITGRGEQIQPVWHPVLSSVGAACESPHDASRSGGQPQPLSDPWQSALSLCGIDRSSLDRDASPTGDRSDSAASEGVRQALSQLPPWSLPVVLHAPYLRQARDPSATRHPVLRKCSEWWTALRRSVMPWWPVGPLPLPAPLRSARGHVAGAFARVRVACAVPATAVAPDSRLGCLGDPRCGGAQPPRGSVAGRFAALRQAGAEALARAWTRVGGTGCIPARSRPAPCTYTHPYTKALRPLVEPVELGMASLEWVGAAWVCDLTVEDANHYITKCGLINKNTGISFDEVTEYATPNGLLKMLSTLRSAKGVPCSVRLSGNPGGVGHIWVKGRYIDPSPPFTPFTDPDTGFTRMFIPSKLSDNPALQHNDPGYMRRLLAATAGSEALRQAWLDGKWDIVAGAFFEHLSRDSHGVTPFTIPANWLRFRSFDWGSAKPFSVGWWALVQDSGTYGGKWLPRGAIVRYREWYGMKANAPNVGLKLTANQVADGIKEREAGETVDYGVADPSIWKVDGGPSIAERMLDRGVGWMPADNSRKSGWEQMRDRMLGEDEQPMLYAFTSCVNFWRTVPLMQHDKDRIEDIDTDMEDHVADEARYACMSRPWKPATKHEVPATILFAQMPKVSDLMKPQKKATW